MKILDLEQNTPEWEAFRRTHIGASDSPTICGVNPYKSAYKLWKEKAIGEKQPINDAMAKGAALEPEARKKASMHYGMEFTPLVIQHEEHDFLMASLDGFNPSKGALLEIKVVGDNTFAKTKEEGPLRSWIYQVHHQMECVGSCIDRAFIFVMHRESGHYHPFVVEREEEIIKEILLKDKEFYDRLINFNPPADTHRHRDDGTWKVLAEKLLETKKIAEEAEAEMKKLRDALIAACEGESCKGCGVTATKYMPKGSVDYSAIPEIKSIDLDKYRKPSKETWRVA
jgi:putative phage-type endonuclease